MVDFKNSLISRKKQGKDKGLKKGRPKQEVIKKGLNCLQ